MKPLLRSLVFALTMIVLAGCGTVDSRIHSHQAAFDNWPADIRERVQAGHIDVGFTREMVEVALGGPDRTASRTTAQGTSEVWIYFDRGPKFSIGIGGASFGSHSAVGGGVVVGNNGFRDNEVMRVIFNGSIVEAIETRK